MPQIFTLTVTTENMLCLFVCLFVCLFQKFCLETEPRVTRLEADFETAKVRWCMIEKIQLFLMASSATF